MLMIIVFKCGREDELSVLPLNAYTQYEWTKVKYEKAEARYD